MILPAVLFRFSAIKKEPTTPADHRLPCLLC
nr:MAG TPA: hypothetical protein [Caudoviricetes sp.]